MAAHSAASSRNPGTGLWLGRFEPPRPLRVGGAFRVYGTRRVSTGEDVVVVVGAPSAACSEVLEALDEAARVHGLLSSPFIASVDERGAVGELEFLALRAQAKATVETLREVAGPHDRVPYEAGFVLLETLMRALAAAHATTDPRTGRPICLGAVSTHNLLVGERGRLTVMGFGNHLLATEGVSGPRIHPFSTPEVWAGAPPTPGDDLFAAVQLALSLLPMVAITPELEHIMSSQGVARGPLAEAIGGLLQQTIYAPPGQRLASAEGFLEQHEALLVTLGKPIDHEGFGDYVDDLLRRVPSGGAKQGGEAGWAPVAGRDLADGRYLVVRTLGQGATGTVVLARDRELRQDVALKLVRREVEEQAGERFRREVRILRRVQHPNLVRGYDFFEAGPYLVGVLELVEGDTLDAFLRDNPDDRLTAARLLADLAEGLHALHQVGVVHRDVKPANILIHERRGAILVDLGIARELEATNLTRTGTFVGTPGFMSPEQAAGRPVDWASDVYSLCCVLRSVLGDKAGAAPATETLPPALEALLQDGLQADAARRPSAAELARRLRMALATEIDALAPEALLVGPEGRWFRPPGGARVDLSRRRALRLILLALARRRRRAEDGGLPLAGVIEAGWPDERILPEAANNRAYVALSTLRKLGLHEVLESLEEGYRLAPEVPLVWPAPGSRPRPSDGG